MGTAPRRSAASRLARARRGSMLPLVAMGISALAATGALTVDAGWLYLQRDRLQQTADAVALAGARQLPDELAARAAALDFAVRVLGEDGALFHPGDLTTGTWDRQQRRFVKGGGAAANAMRVEVQRTRARENAVQTFLARLFGIGEMEFVASAVARRATPGCVYVLDPAGGKALDLSGNASLAVPGCEVQVNSDAADALVVSGDASVTALETCVVGDYNLNGGGSARPPPLTGCRAVSDPLAGFVPPQVGSCDWTNRKITGAAVLTPGVYCGGISVTGGAAAVFLPGVYVIKDGPLKVAGNSTLSGAGVGFYLTGGGAELALTGGGRIDLSAPTSGPMAGFVFAAGPDVPAGTSNKIAGGGQMRFEGALYFPRQELTLSGGSDSLSPSPFTLIVAWGVKITGGGTLRFAADPDHPAVPPPFRPQTAPVVVQ
ncbi:Tad domain-containing protein [Marinimicrococcus flavescens]|uniref:Tad domain-containing protein n=1 Tax=Marinimicrococcus flavescens TaxID=3031815 RepID=A0AAP3XR21_9PROT|nr:Tad domain-containing protein [Marinimicrococcus flavescens]